MDLENIQGSRNLGGGLVFMGFVHISEGPELSNCLENKGVSCARKK